MSAELNYSASLHAPSFFPHPPLLDRVWEKNYCVRLCDDSWLEIPLKPLPSGQEAIALLMSNQCDFTITDHITTLMAQVASRFHPECIAAVPTMGLEYAPRVAQKLGHANYTALGFSHKYWYEGATYEKIVSVTSPGQEKRLYLDPHLLYRVKGKRVVVVDDVINTGASIFAAVSLLKKLGAHVVATVVVLTEGRAWEQTMSASSIAGSATVQGIGHLPIFTKHKNGWIIDQATLR